MLQGYRTYLVSFLVGVFGALAVVDWNLVISDPKAGWTLVGTAVLMAIMRTLTTTPPGVAPPK